MKKPALGGLTEGIEESNRLAPVIVPRPDRLPQQHDTIDLTRKADALQAELKILGRRAFDVALELGSVLVDVKGRLRHGEWTDWLNARGIKVRSAQIYMQIASMPAGQIESYRKNADSAHLSVAGLLGHVKEKRDLETDAVEVAPGQYEMRSSNPGSVIAESQPKPRLRAETDPEFVAEQVKALRGSMTEKQRMTFDQKFDAAVAYASRRAGIDLANEILKEQRAKLAEREKKLNEWAETLRAREDDVTTIWTEDEYERIRRQLHPDRAGPDVARAKALAEVFVLFERAKPKTRRYSVEVRRRRGWE